MKLLYNYIRKNLAFFLTFVGTAGAVCTIINAATAVAKVDYIAEDSSDIRTSTDTQ